MLLRQIAVLSTTVALFLSITACNASPKIESEDQALDHVIDYLNNKYFDGENCLRLVMEESEKAGADGRPSYWENTVTTEWVQESESPSVIKVTGLIYVIVRRFDRPGSYAEHGMEWLVYEDGRIDAQHKYPPC